MSGSAQQPDDAVLTDAEAEIMRTASDIYIELTERLLDSGHRASPGEWEARYRRRVREPTLAFPVEDAIIAAAQRIHQRTKRGE